MTVAELAERLSIYPEEYTVNIVLDGERFTLMANDSGVNFKKQTVEFWAEEDSNAG
jgi:hypothetical protein